MPAEIYTYKDALDALVDFATAYAAAPQAVLRRCIRAARDEIIGAHDWSFLYKNAPILLRAPQKTGTCVYDHTGGATCERQLTLTDATWPDWAVNAAVRIDELVCDVQEVHSDTVLQLDSVMNPGQDVAAGESYVLYPRWYQLPVDFGSMVEVAEKATWSLGEYVSGAEMFADDKYQDDTGDVQRYWIGPAQDQYGVMALYVHPASDATERIDFLYKKRIRDLRYSGANSAEFTGTIEVTAGSATVTGTGTAFDAGMVGAILRIAPSTTVPTGLEGITAWVEQVRIKSVETTESLTLDSVVVTTRADVAYVISDPIDIDVVAWQAFLACCQKHFAVARNLKNTAGLFAVYKDALFLAKEGDCRYVGRRVCGVGHPRVVRLADGSGARDEVP